MLWITQLGRPMFLYQLVTMETADVTISLAAKMAAYQSFNGKTQKRKLLVNESAFKESR